FRIVQPSAVGVRFAQLGNRGARLVPTAQFVERISLPVEGAFGAGAAVGRHAIEIGKGLVPLAAVERALAGGIKAVIAPASSSKRLELKTLRLSADLVGLSADLVGLDANLRDLVLERGPELEIKVERDVQ